MNNLFPCFYGCEVESLALKKERCEETPEKVIREHFYIGMMKVK
jgi:hypothetical protein